MLNIKATLAKPYAIFIYNKLKQNATIALKSQQKIFSHLLEVGKKTIIGNDYRLAEVSNYKEFQQAVPLKKYEDLLPYIEKIKAGTQNVLWKGLPIYFAKSSGTTSGAKYLPITKESISNHISAARNALLCYMAETGNSKFVNGKMIFLSGSPELQRMGDIPTGRLSGIVNHHVPYYLRKNQLPSYTTNCIKTWEEKLQHIVTETIEQNMTLISGIPPWVQMYFDELIKIKQKPVGEIFPEFSVMVHGGVNFEPYRPKLMQSIGRKIDLIETYPASEGFFAFQDSQHEEGLRLNVNSGIFYEFIPLDEFQKPNPSRVSLEDVKLGVNYVIVINSNAGFWGYVIGDTIKFVSLSPYKISVTGRIAHFISAFGEHVIAEEVEQAMTEVLRLTNVSVTEFTVAPMVQQGEGKSYHEWLIEFETLPNDLTWFATELNNIMCRKNIYYDDLIKGNILKPLVITPIQKDGFVNYMRSIGKLGGQNKPPRLSNNRNVADVLQQWKMS